MTEANDQQPAAAPEDESVPVEAEAQPAEQPEGEPAEAVETDTPPTDEQVAASAAAEAGATAELTEPEPAVDEPQAEEPEAPAAEEPIPPEDHPQYVIRHWSGYDNYVCTQCGQGFLTTSDRDGRSDVLDHFWNEHAKPTAPRPGSGLILDSQGNPIY